MSEILKFATVVVYADDVRATVAFYRRVTGLAPTYYDADLGFALLGEHQAVAIASHVAGMLMLADGYGHARSNQVRGTELAFWTRDVAAAFQIAVETGAMALSAVAYLKGEMTDDQEVHITLSERASPVLRNLGHGLLLPISLTKVSISLMCNIITLPTRCSIAMNSTLKQLLTLLLLPKTRRGPTLRKYKLAETILKEFSRALSVEVERMSG